MKKYISLLLSCIILLSCTSMAFTGNAYLNDKEYFEKVTDILKDYSDNPVSAREALAELDTELLGEPTTTFYHGDHTQTRGTSPSDYKLTVTSYKRGNSSIHYLEWILDANRSETFPGPLDYVSLEWDTKYASYYLSEGDDAYSTVQARNTGIVLFNLEDKKMKKGDRAYGIVEVKPTGQNGWMEFGSKYVHTYLSFLATGSASYSFSPSSSVKANGDFGLGLSYTYGFIINVSGKTNKWQIWNDNAVNL